MRNATKNLIALSAAGLASIAGLTATTSVASAGNPASYQLVGQPSVVEKNTTTTMYAPLIVTGDHAQPTIVSLTITPAGANPASAADFDQALAFQVVVPAHAQGVQVPVKIKGDVDQEANETFRLAITGLSAPGNVGAPVIATIKNDDLPLQQPPADPPVPDDKAPLPQDDPEQPQDKAPLPQDDPAPVDPEDEAPAADQDEADQPTTDADDPATEVDEAALPVASTTSTSFQHDRWMDDGEVAGASTTEATPASTDEAGFPMALVLGLGLGAAVITGGVIAARRRTATETA